MKESLSKKLAYLPAHLQDWLAELPAAELLSILQAAHQHYMSQASETTFDDLDTTRTYVLGEADPVPYGLPTPGKVPTPGAWRNHIWISDDFDAPLEGFEDYRP